MITGGGNLRAKHAIHTVGPIYRASAADAETLASCYGESIRLAQKHALTSSAFTSISTGAYGYPVRDAALVAVSAVMRELERTTHLKRYDLCFDSATLQAYTEAATKLLATSKHAYKIEGIVPCELN